MTLQQQAQTIRFFEGLGKPLSTREIEILAADEWQRDMREADEACQQFASGFVKALCEHEDRMMMEEGRTCAECQYFAMGRCSGYCHEFHRPREVFADDVACEWFGKRGDAKKVSITIEDLRKLANAQDNLDCIGSIDNGPDDPCAEANLCPHVEICKKIAEQL